jgi:hypothetical protein
MADGFAVYIRPRRSPSRDEARRIAVNIARLPSRRAIPDLRGTASFLDSRLRGNERQGLASRRRRRYLIEPRAHMIDEITRRRFWHAEHAQRIEPARTLDADRIPEEAADMRDLGYVREWQMFVDAPPRRQPEIDIAGGDADLIRTHAGRKQQARAVEMKRRPQPA